MASNAEYIMSVILCETSCSKCRLHSETSCSKYRCYAQNAEMHILYMLK